MSNTAESSRVSVVVTCYNGQRWIGQAIDSALAQSYPHRRIIAVDDGSEDSSPAVLERYRRNAGLEVVRHPRNRGIPSTKNTGLRQASGEYVAFLEQDDQWEPEYLERQVSVLDSDSRLGMVFSSAVYLDPEGCRLLRQRPVLLPQEPPQAVVEAFFRRNPVTAMSSVVMRRSAVEELGGFDERYWGADDYDLWLRMAGAYRIAHLAETLVLYRVHSGSFSMAAADRMLADRLAIVERAVDRYPYLAPLRRRRLAEVRLSTAMRLFECGAGSKALHCAWGALRSDPALARCYPALALILSGRPGRYALNQWRRRIQFRGVG